MIGGVVLFLGTLIYGSAKKRTLNVECDNKLRRLLEQLILVLIVLLTVCQNNYLNLVQNEPIDNLVIPLVTVFAYFFINSKNN